MENNNEIEEWESIRFLSLVDYVSFFTISIYTIMVAYKHFKIWAQIYVSR